VASSGQILHFTFKPLFVILELVFLDRLGRGGGAFSGYISFTDVCVCVCVCVW
jgi:hypothetical protein